MSTRTSLVGTRNTQRTLVWCTALLLILVGFVRWSPLAAQELNRDRGALRVMTYNVDEGTDFLEVEHASNQTQFLIAVGQTISDVRATKPAERMQAVAQQILDAKAMLVSLQELDQWATGTFNPATGACEGMHVETDMLSELLTGLSAQGGQYWLVVRAQQFAFPPTPGLILPNTFVCVAVVNENAMLARTDLDPAVFHIDAAQAGQFASKVLLPTPIGVIPIPRAWVAADAHFHQQALRLIGTHLEADDAQIREAQGGELRAGPASRTPDGLWPSDHASVAARVQISANE